LGLSGPDRNERGQADRPQETRTMVQHDSYPFPCLIRRRLPLQTGGKQIPITGADTPALTSSSTNHGDGEVRADRDRLALTHNGLMAAARLVCAQVLGELCNAWTTVE
jgi:hypothetical protein